MADRTMADRAGLEVLGFIFGAVTAVVMLIAAFVVHSHLDHKLTLDAAAPVLPVSLTTRAR
jgi:hypothetical protein